MQYFICKKRCFSTADNRLVPEDDPAAAILLAGAGRRMSEKELEKVLSPDQDEASFLQFFIPEEQYVPPVPKAPDTTPTPLVTIQGTDGQVRPQSGAAGSLGGGQQTFTPVTSSTAGSSAAGVSSSTVKVNPEEDVVTTTQ